MDLENKTPATFVTHGFLAKEMSHLGSVCKAAHPEWFDLVDRLNRLCQDALSQLDVKNKDVQAVGQSALFIHVLQTFQAVINCVSIGMQPQAIMLLRSVLEGTFKLKAITVDPKKCIPQYGKEQLLNQIGLAEAVNKSYLEHGDRHFSEDEIKKVRKGLRELRKNKVKKWTVSEWADIGDLGDLYLLEYQLFCLPVHATAGHIEEVLIKTPEGKVTEINPLPTFELILGVIDSAVNALLISLECVEPLAKKKSGHASVKSRRKQILKQLHSVSSRNFE